MQSHPQLSNRVRCLKWKCFMHNRIVMLLNVWLFSFVSCNCCALTLDQVDDWTYQLQGYPNSLNELQQSHFDLVVIDYSMDGSASTEWTHQQIKALKTSGPCGDRIVLAYISIGEAENYRFYWNPDWVDGSGTPIPGIAPDWLGPQNPDWPGNYKTRFWMSGWQSILFGTPSGPEKSMLDRIIDQGFDGIYMDIIDAFEYWGPSEIGGTDENRNAGKEMIDLVIKMADYAHITRQCDAFYLFPQNGSYIIDPDVYPDAANPTSEAAYQMTRYFAVIDGIGAEDTFFIGPSPENNPYQPDTWTIALLNQFRDAGKIVLSIEYVTQPTLISAYYTNYAPQHSYIPYATVRDLGTMTVNTGFEPDCESPPDKRINISLYMGQSRFGAGDTCQLFLDLINTGSTQTADMYILLEVYNEYFTYPDWNAIQDGLGYARRTVEQGFSSLEIISPFTMPTVPDAGPFYFYGIMFEPEHLDMAFSISNLTRCEFYLGPNPY